MFKESYENNVVLCSVDGSYKCDITKENIDKKELHIYIDDLIISKKGIEYILKNIKNGDNFRKETFKTCSICGVSNKGYEPKENVIILPSKKGELKVHTHCIEDLRKTFEKILNKIENSLYKDIFIEKNKDCINIRRGKYSYNIENFKRKLENPKTIDITDGSCLYCDNNPIDSISISSEYTESRSVGDSEEFSVSVKGGSGSFEYDWSGSTRSPDTVNGNIAVFNYTESDIGSFTVSTTVTDTVTNKTKTKTKIFSVEDNTGTELLKTSNYNIDPNFNSNKFYNLYPDIQTVSLPLIADNTGGETKKDIKASVILGSEKSSYNGTVSAGSTKEFNIPVKAPSNGFYSLEIKASGEQIQKMTSIPVVYLNIQKSQLPTNDVKTGEEINYKVAVDNPSDTTDTVDYSIQLDDSSGSASLTVSPGETKTKWINITAPDTAGDYNLQFTENGKSLPTSQITVRDLSYSADYSSTILIKNESNGVDVNINSYLDEPVQKDWTLELGSPESNKQVIISGNTEISPGENSFTYSLSKEKVNNIIESGSSQGVLKVDDTRVTSFGARMLTSLDPSYGSNWEGDKRDVSKGTEETLTINLENSLSYYDYTFSNSDIEPERISASEQGRIEATYLYDTTGNFNITVDITKTPTGESTTKSVTFNVTKRR